MTEPPDREIIEARLESLRQTLDTLESLRGMTLDEYLGDAIRRSAAERLFCRLVEIAAEINSHIATRVLKSAPNDYYDSFVMASDAGALDRDFAASIAPSAGVRNRLVHEYGTVDHARVHTFIGKALELYRLYLREIVAFLDRAPGRPR